MTDGVAAIAALALARPPRLGAVRLIAVDGPSGSGKTTFAATLAVRIAALGGGRVVRPARVSGDGPAPDRGAAPGGPVPGDRGEGEGVRVAVVSTDLLATWEEPLSWWPLVEGHLLVPLAAGRPGRLPVVQWVSGHPRPGGYVTVPVVDVLILEGVSSGRAAVADRLTALVWVEVPGADVRLDRAVARDGEPMRPYLRRWQRQESAHFIADGTRDRADVVIDPSRGDGLPTTG